MSAAFEKWWEVFKHKFWSKTSTKDMVSEAWQAATLAERERCAKIAEDHFEKWIERDGTYIAAAIRAQEAGE